MAKFVKVFKILLLLAFLCLFLFLLNKYFSFSGNLELSYNFCAEPTVISALEPIGRAQEREQNLKTGDCYQTISGEPTYFTVTVPRSFDTAAVTLTYKNPAQKIVELGLQKSTGWFFDLKPLENKFISSSHWSKLASDNLILLQKEKNYNNIGDFINNLPQNKKIAIYNYQPKINYSLDNYQSNSTLTSYDTALKGSHIIYTYLAKGEDLNFTFNWHDLNLIEGADDFTVKVIKDDTEITSGFSKDEDIITTNSKKIELTNLSGGLYKIVLNLSDDLVIDKIETKQNKFVFKDKINIADAVTAQNIITNADLLSFYTDSPVGLQEVNINDDKFSVDSINTTLAYKNDNLEVGSQKKISMPKNNLKIHGAGYFSFIADNFFDPDYGVDYLRNDTNIEKYDYLLAYDFSSQVTIDSTKTMQATQNFDLANVPGDRKKLTFLISAPGLDKIKENMTLFNIAVKLQRKPITINTIFDKIKKIF